MSSENLNKTKMEVQGKVIKVLPSQSGSGAKGPWTKHEFVIETEGQYPKKICLQMFSKGESTLQVTEGDTIKASVNLESREYNGKWYSNISAYKLEVTAYGAKTPKKGAPVSDDGFGWNGSRTVSPPASDTDDLPF